MNTTSSSSSVPSRALVVGGGGAAGNAWALGVIAGLADAGIDVTDADLVVGTSSGATVAAQITSGTRPADLYAAVLAEPSRPHGAGGSADTGAARPSTGPAGSGPAGTGPAGSGPAGAVSGQSYLDWSNAIIASAADAADMRRRMGAAALERDASDGADGARWREIVARRLPGADWPRQRIVIAAVDARSGEPVAFDRDSGVALVDAVAASTSAMAPYPLGDTRYLNGGYRRNENADLAAGHDRILVLSPFGGRSRMPQGWGMDLASQVAELRAGGSDVQTVFPDDATSALFDANALDPATRLAAARGGHEQGRGLAESVTALWR